MPVTRGRFNLSVIASVRKSAGGAEVLDTTVLPATTVTFVGGPGTAEPEPGH